MYNLKKNTYVVVEFTEINGHFSGIYDSRTKQDLSFASSPIIEIAAVKIQKGEISEHYTNFIGLDGVQAKNLCEEMSSLTDKGITPTHLIGAPSLEETVRKLYDFTRDCIILVQYKTPFFNTPFDTFQLYARSFGYVFNNPVFGILDTVQAAKLKKPYSFCLNQFGYLKSSFVYSLVSCPFIQYHHFGGNFLPPVHQSQVQQCQLRTACCRALQRAGKVGHRDHRLLLLPRYGRRRRQRALFHDERFHSPQRRRL